MMKSQILNGLARDTHVVQLGIKLIDVDLQIGIGIYADDNTYKDEGSDLKIMRLLIIYI